jgi:Na+-translocating membrane potential-generating system (MpsC)
MRRSPRRPDPRPRPLAQRTSSAVATPAPESPALAPKCSANSAIGSTTIKPSAASGSVIARRRTNTDAESSAAVTRMLALCRRSARVVRDSWTSASSRWGRVAPPGPRARVNATPPGRGVRGVIAPAEDGATSPCRVLRAGCACQVESGAFALLTQAERSLVTGGQADAVERTRRGFQELMRPYLRSTIERLTGCTVRAFLSANHLDPDVGAELFVLDRPIAEPPPETPTGTP